MNSKKPWKLLLSLLSLSLCLSFFLSPTPLRCRQIYQKIHTHLESSDLGVIFLRSTVRAGEHLHLLMESRKEGINTTRFSIHRLFM
jgi:hypothetical protein